MPTTNDETICCLTVEIADDRMQAWLKVKDKDGLASLTYEEVEGLLGDSNIKVDGAVKGRIEALLSSIEKQEECSERILVAQGLAAVDGKDAEFQWHESFDKAAADWRDDAAVNYYSLNSIHTVEKDEPIGTLIPKTSAKDGVDVLGTVLTPKRKGNDIELDSTVRMEDGEVKTVFAGCCGRVMFEGGKLFITEVFLVRGDVDFETGHVDSSVNVEISGTVREQFTVKSAKAITVGGAIEAADVEAKGDVVIRGGILARGKAQVRTEGDLVAKFCEEANLFAAGDVKICKEVMHSKIHAEGHLLAAAGAVIGGSIYAREGVEVATLGSDANVPTEIIVGIHPEVIRQAEQLRLSVKPKSETAKKIRSTVQPLMAEIKRLSPAQREKVTELMFQADTLDAEITEVENKRTEMLEAARAKGDPNVLVSKVIFPRTVVRIGRRQTVFSEIVRGPVKIEKRKIEGHTEFVAYNQLTSSVKVLPSAYVEEEYAPQASQPTAEEGTTPDGSSG